MKRILLALKLTALLSTAFGTNAWANYNDGLAAYQARNYPRAVKEFTPLANQGNREAQHLLGLMHYTGQGIPQNYKQALTWFQKAASQGQADAQYILGAMYYTGKGTAKDEPRAVVWFRKAAEQGHADAQYLLGLTYLYRAGGMPKDVVLAYMLWNLSAASGNANAAEQRTQVAKRMTPEQIEEGQALSSSWKVGTPLPTGSKTGRG
ncbi:MAG TPA: tetratricopeptide repeat protein [Paucimonas sp.]|nr:tetratricopeptide repeat protein [Paucimonas sp.]